MKTVFRALIAVVLAISLATGPAAVACCDDFWSCAAAVATGGLSCAVEDLINSIKTMIHNVETLVNAINRDVGEVKDAALGGVKAAGDDLRALVQTAEKDLATAAQAAAGILNRVEHPPASVRLPAGTGVVNAGVASAVQPTPNASGAGAPAPKGQRGGFVAPMTTPCEQATMIDLLRRAKEQADLQVAEAQKRAQAVNKHALDAEAAVRSKFDFAVNMANDLLIRPLTDLKSMLGDLITHPLRLFNPVDMVNDLVTRITNNIAKTMNDMTDELVRDANGLLALARTPAQAAQASAAAAKHLVAQMDALEKNRTQGNCDKLASLIPRANVNLVAHLQSANVALDTSSHQQLVARALLKTDAGKTKGQALASKVKGTIAAGWNVAQNKKAALQHPVLPPGATNSLKQHEDAMFRGMNASQIRGKKPELVAEARRRFANDPKTLDKVLAYLDQTIDARARVAR